MGPKYTERNTKQDVQAVQQQYVPHAKERLHSKNLERYV